MPGIPWTVAALTLACSASLAHASFRSPQAPVSGTALQSFLAAQGQAIDVHTQQLDLQRASLPTGTGFTVNAFGAEAASNSFGVYNAALAAPPLYLVFPGATSPGWVAAASFRTGPLRLVINLFDNTGTFVGSTTYLGADPADLGFYVSGPGGTLYSQDARNADGARILAFNGTGARTGYTWFACETGAGPGGDYADAIFLVQLALAPTQVQPTHWGRLKALFR
jgi:hypothetical protein